MSPNSYESVGHGDEKPECTFDILDPTLNLDLPLLALSWGNRLSAVLGGTPSALHFMSLVHGPYKLHPSPNPWH